MTELKEVWTYLKSLKMTKQFFVSLLRFWDISVCLICKLNILGETHVRDSFELICFDNSKDQ